MAVWPPPLVPPSAPPVASRLQWSCGLAGWIFRRPIKLTSLGELGSRIVCETLIGQLRHDPDSYLNHHGGWDPSTGVRLPNGDLIVSIKDFLRFATVLP